MASKLVQLFKGKYRILPELDIETNDVPRDDKGNIISTYDDLYVACRQGNKIYSYGKKKGIPKTIWLIAYIPSKGRGHNVIKALDEKKIEYTNYMESDEEVIFHFKSTDMDVVAELLHARTSGANISPFNKRNLPKSKNVQLSTEKIKEYKTIISVVKKEDLLIIHRITTNFLQNILNKTYRKNDKSFDYKSDMKKLCLSKQVKEYIDVKGMWNEYLSYLKKEIEKYYVGGK